MIEMIEVCSTEHQNIEYRVSHEAWQLVNCYESRISYSLSDIKGFLPFIPLICIIALNNLIKIMEEDILIYWPTVMFLWTPCSFQMTSILRLEGRGKSKLYHSLEITKWDVLCLTLTRLGEGRRVWCPPPLLNSYWHLFLQYSF